MKRILGTIFLACSMLLNTACSPVERQAYNAIVSAKAFLSSGYAAHPECKGNNTAGVCGPLLTATSAKDALIDAAEIYCSGPLFDATTNPGACQPPDKSTSAGQQAEAKLKAAIKLYNQTAKDVKGAL